jgi:hypothetical protein
MAGNVSHARPAITPEQKIDVLKLVYAEEAEALRFEVATAQRLVTYFVTVELALAAWVVTSSIPDRARVVLFVLNACFGVWVGLLVHRNYRRREDIVYALRAAVEALGLADAGEYLPSRPIHDYKYDSSWEWYYIWVIGFFCLAEIVPLFLLLN